MFNFHKKMFTFDQYKLFYDNLFIAANRGTLDLKSPLVETLEVMPTRVLRYNIVTTNKREKKFLNDIFIPL